MSHEKIALVFAAMGTFLDTLGYIPAASLALCHHFFVHETPPFKFFCQVDKQIGPIRNSRYEQAGFAMIPPIADICGHNRKTDLLPVLATWSVLKIPK